MKLVIFGASSPAATVSARAFFGNRSLSQKITRAGVADFMLKPLTSREWLGQATIISN